MSNPDYEEIAKELKDPEPDGKNQDEKSSTSSGSDSDGASNTDPAQPSKKSPDAGPDQKKQKKSKGKSKKEKSKREKSIKEPKSVKPKSKQTNQVKKLQPNEREEKRMALIEKEGKKDAVLNPEANKGADKLKMWVTKNKPIMKPEFPKFAALTSLKTPENKKLFVEKLKWCRVTYDFHSADMDHQVESKKNKLEALNEINRLIIGEHSRLDKQIYENVMIMVSINIFRNLPRLPMHTDPRGWNQEEDIAPKDPAWMHIRPSYDILFSLLNGKSFKVSMGKKYIDKKFAITLLRNFNANDAEERAKAKLCVHRIYSHFVKVRRRILPELINMAMQHLTEGEQFLGIKETLELLGTIVTGFLVPLKAENEALLKWVFLPLYKCSNLPVFYPALFYIVAQYAVKKPILTKKILYWLTVNWPQCRNKREILYFQTLEEILQITPPDIFKEIYTWLCNHLARCVSSPNAQVSKKSLNMWNNDYFVALVAIQPARIIAIYTPYVTDTAENHWHKDSKIAAINLFETFECVNEAAYAKMAKQSIQRKQKEEKHRNKISATLERLSKRYPPPAAPSKDKLIQKQQRKSQRKSIKTKSKMKLKVKVAKK